MSVSCCINLCFIFFIRPALIQSTETMKCLLDSMVVLTKQDRLCHVIHATSDPFYQTWLRQLNASQHCKVRFVSLSKTDVLMMKHLCRSSQLVIAPNPRRKCISMSAYYHVYPNH